MHHTKVYAFVFLIKKLTRLVSCSEEKRFRTSYSHFSQLAFHFHTLYAFLLKSFYRYFNSEINTVFTCKTSHAGPTRHLMQVQLGDLNSHGQYGNTTMRLIGTQFAILKRMLDISCSHFLHPVFHCRTYIRCI
ncbi:hypothetical protein KP509_01G102300 [Ceratopteris richardii]|uniref:Uncharacterized protein n=1 Tax=Ceratopteris richardii TaxID=49495 RepID=A0A8T2VP81_CERRI|nr:hypothetical protein KP509_01G102300 [Ceratopteris richardii]KAH7447345.1 hypothetical protein KP509_01G102300 [Ceratopteris richardii]